MTIADKRKEYRLINILFKTIYKKKSAKWRGDYLRNKHIFHQIGNNVHLWGGVPSDPYLISIGNNVIIAVSVEFVTHDIFYHALNQTYSDLGEFYPHFDTITIEDNVCIGGFSKIMPGVVIGEVYNVGGHNEKQNIEIVKIICKELGKPESLITHVGDRKGHDMRYAIDPTKIHNELGWLPETKFEDGIKKTIQWYLDNREWWETIISGEYQNYYEKMYSNR